MNANTAHDERRRDRDIEAGVRKRMGQVLFSLALQAAALFLSSWQFDWVWAWVFVGIHVVGISINAIVVLRYSPETAAERAKTGGMRNWDIIIAGLWAVMYFVVVLLVAGLDARFGWTGRTALALHIGGIVGFVVGSALFNWAMLSNAYFATAVRIQEERGHAVCSTGPYRFVRHPGYLGMVIQTIGIPLMLGSLWALVPGGLASLLMIVRTALEDRTLQEELDGYADYTRRVRYRLLPGVW